jgi:hypothetical protein
VLYVCRISVLVDENGSQDWPDHSSSIQHDVVSEPPSETHKTLFVVLPLPPLVLTVQSDEPVLLLEIRNKERFEVFMHREKNHAIDDLYLCSRSRVGWRGCRRFCSGQGGVNVPFSFETGGKIIPAGTYEVEFDPKLHALNLSSKTDMKLSYTWPAGPAECRRDRKKPASLGGLLLGVGEQSLDELVFE